jgi:hypothetical protein
VLADIVGTEHALSHDPDHQDHPRSGRRGNRFLDRAAKGAARCAAAVRRRWRGGDGTVGARPTVKPRWPRPARRIRLGVARSILETGEKPPLHPKFTRVRPAPPPARSPRQRPSPHELPSAVPALDRQASASAGATDDSRPWLCELRTAPLEAFTGHLFAVFHCRGAPCTSRSRCRAATRTTVTPAEHCDGDHTTLAFTNDDA